jgi:bacterioferritin-associated ferredoxin
MYVCVCNALNTRTVTEAIDDGAETVGQVYRACGAVPQCGKCKDLIREMLAERAPTHVTGPIPGMPADPLPAAVRAA